MTLSLSDTLASPAASFDQPRLLADVGGTNARFALETASGRFEAVQVFSGADYATLADAIRAYLASPEAAAIGKVSHAAIAIANPVDGDQVRMTNHHWHFSIEGMRQEVGFDTLLVVNDFTALAMSLPGLPEPDLVRIGGG
ncbi:MAG TPA: bifunctional transcriptional regulator/glucokinase, partial [Massilia sp.]|nr:bifunctional transcriptional regulator/glucokinase [Massilia sp.]